MARRAQSRVTTDHEEIRRWAEERGAIPVRVHGTEGSDDVGIIRLAFPSAPGAKDEKLEPISWDEWSAEFDRRGLALLYEETTATGQKSNSNKIISRETAEAREQGDTKASRRSGRRKSTGKRLAVAVAAGRLRSTLRRRSTKSASQEASSGTRAASSRKKTTKAASGTRSTGRKSQSAAASAKRSGGRKTAPAKRASNVRSISSARGSAGAGRTASVRGRQSKGSSRRAA
jgi:hypothetical protein